MSLAQWIRGSGSPEVFFSFSLAWIKSKLYLRNGVKCVSWLNLAFIMQFSKVLYWQHDIFKGPFLINKVQNHSLDYACRVSIKRYRLWKQWIGALLALDTFAFSVTILREDQAGATYFRTEENLFSRFGGDFLCLNGQRRGCRFQAKTEQVVLRMLRRYLLFACLDKAKISSLGQMRGGQKILFPKSKLRKLWIYRSSITITITSTVNIFWISPKYPMSFFGSCRGKKAHMSVICYKWSKCNTEWDINGPSWVTVELDISVHSLEDDESSSHLPMCQTLS